MKQLSLLLFLLIIGLSSKINAQEVKTFEIAFDWDERAFTSNLVTGEQAKRISFSDATFDRSKEFTPIYSKRFKLNGPGKIRVQLEDYTLLGESPYKTIDISDYEAELTKQLNNTLEFQSSIDQNRREYFGKFSFNPIIKTSSGIQYLKTATIKVTHYAKNEVTLKTPFTDNSVLRNGDIYKLELSQTGIYKLTGSYLSSTMGINLNNISPENIQVFSNRGGIVPRAIANERIDDLTELAIFIEGDEDGSFDSNDAIYFYATGAETWIAKEGEENFIYNDNPYDVVNFAFLKIGDDTGKRVTINGSTSNDIESVSQYLEKERYEKNEINILASNFSTLGTGTQWYGEYFDQIQVQDFSSKLNITNIIPSKTALFRANFAGRAFSSNDIVLKVNNSEVKEKITQVSTQLYSSAFARERLLELEVVLNEGNPSIVLDHSHNSAAEGWLDYIEAQYIRDLRYNGQQIEFSNLKIDIDQAFSFTIKEGSGLTIWDITSNGNESERITASSNSNLYFDCPNESVHSYVAFNKSADLLQPDNSEKIDNQNLHNIMDTDIILITTEALLPAAEKLAEHRMSKDGFSIKIVDINSVYNEFSCGRVDPTSIRDLFKMVYDRDENFKYGILFGNGTYDYKGIVFEKEKYNLIPVYETPNSIDPIESFPSDDYFGLLSPQDGGNLEGEVDLSIGRIPVANLSQANLVVDKIIKYETDISIRGPWNNRSVFLADDEDTNTHIDPADSISEEFLAANSNINLEKIYFDSYTQLSTPGGERYPDVTDEINNNIFRGSLTFCYMGHGGPSGFAQERVLQVDNIDNWKNERSYPLFITATCSLASYDDPEVFSAGEKIVVNKNGGVALFTTSRAVYSNDNTRLTRSVHNFLLKQDDNGEHLTIGEILRQAKNSTKGDTVNENARKFLLLGDPSMKLLYPTLEVTTTKINDQDVINGTLTDTISSLSKMKIEGFISENGEKITDYNGEINVTIFDKRTNRKTLEQDPGSLAKNFLVQKNLIFKGKAKVTNGEFNLEFIVPKDILFNIGKAKISYYATNGDKEAVGNFQEFYVGGSSNNSIEDDTPPVVEVFMNDENFVSGGLTNSEPVLLAKISDDNGINLSGSSVGHDLTGKLDNNSSDSYYLNDFFESELNNFSKGTVRYPLDNIEEGVHRINVQAWDIANNVGEGSTEFVVSNNLDGGLEHVLNYPNPFTDNTCFMFEHNLAPDVMDIQIDIYTVSGKLVKTILHNSMVEGFRVADIKWDGNDDFGGNLGRGVYLYKIKVKAQSQNVVKESAFEKLVILK